jgi:hypothetical protein
MRWCRDEVWPLEQTEFAVWTKRGRRSR